LIITITYIAFFWWFFQTQLCRELFSCCRPTAILAHPRHGHHRDPNSLSGGDPFSTAMLFQMMLDVLFCEMRRDVKRTFGLVLGPIEAVGATVGIVG
jgi:hypothetical protein